MVKSKRIQALAALTKGYDTVIDIGCDHGLVLLEAFEKGYINQAIACDLREKPLQAAKKNLEQYPVTYIQTDGFKGVHQPFDLGIIAGMGSYLICDILAYAPKKDMILQANDKIDVLRACLSSHGFYIKDEWVIHDRFYYVMIKAVPGDMMLSEEDLILGPKLKFKPEAKPYYHKKAMQIKKILNQVDEKRKTELINQIKIYEDM